MSYYNTLAFNIKYVKKIIIHTLYHKTFKTSYSKTLQVIRKLGAKCSKKLCLFNFIASDT